MSEEELFEFEEETPQKRPGAPRGNQNARKHGFYSKKITRKEQAYLEKASEIRGLNQEIALLRARIKVIQETCPADHELMLKALPPSPA